MTTGYRHFPIRFDRWYAIMSAVVLLPPSSAYIEVSPYEVEVKMSWGFRATFPKSAVAAARRIEGKRTMSRGVHGFAGRWLVNGSAQGLVSLILSPHQRGFVMGFPVKLSELMVSVEDPDGFIAAIEDREEASG